MIKVTLNNGKTWYVDDKSLNRYGVEGTGARTLMDNAIRGSSYITLPAYETEAMTGRPEYIICTAISSYQIL